MPLHTSVLSETFRVGLLIVLTLLVPVRATAQAAPTGIIEGRVFNPATGEYFEFVRVTVEGSTAEALTDATGYFRLATVPAGPATVRVFRTGLAAQTRTVAVTPGETAVQNFPLSAGTNEAVKLAQFVVSTSAEMDGAAIAINTQRFAPNVINVVAADEFGTVASGNVGEVLKAVPGVSLTPGGLGAPNTVSLNGVPPNNVPLTVGGFNLANAASGTQRTVALHQVSINNISRVEVSYTPTPESSGAALAGSVNLVPRSAFERSKPVYNYQVALTMRDSARNFGKSATSKRAPARTINPSIDLSAIVPVDSRFGFTVSASSFSAYLPQAFAQATWRGAGAVTNGNAFPDTTADRPYLSDYAVRDGSALQQRKTFGTTVDYKLTPADRFSFSFQYGQYYDRSANQMLSFFTNRVAAGAFTPTATTGAAGAGEIRMTNAAFMWDDRLIMPSLTYRHDGPVWKAELAAGLSHSDRNRRDLVNGHFNNVQARRQNVTVSFADIGYLRPGTIRVATAAGAAVDPFVLDSYTLNTANSEVLGATDTQRNLFGSLRRDLPTRIPLTLKAGADLRQSIKDIRGDTPTYTFTAANAGAAQVYDAVRSQRGMPFGFPALERVSNDALYELFRSSPGSFTLNEAARYTGNTQTSKYAEETVAAAYLRADAQLLQGRLKLVGGLRAEQTNAEGEGQLIDQTRNFRRDAAGRFILGTNGRPLPIATDPLEVARLTNVDRGLRAEKEYLRWFPSLNAAYNVRDNLIARAGYYWSVGRPDYAQYAGSLTLPDTSALPSATNLISVNNPNVKAWSARTTKVTLEYYFDGVGLFSVGGFHREIENFFANTVTDATPAFLSGYGLDPAVYDAYDVSTQTNLDSTVRMTGLDLNYKQALTFLPAWARGLQVFANASTLRTQGAAAANFAGFVPRTVNAGLSFTRDRYNLRVRWNHTGRNRRAQVTGRGIEGGTYNWGEARTLFDVSGEFVLRKNVALFANLNNLTDAPLDVEIHGPNTPEHAQFRQRQTFGSMWTFGVKGSF
jgi:TonB-dependent receptor